MEKLEKTFKQYLDIRVGSFVRKLIEEKRESRPSLDAAIKDALGKTFRFHSGDGTSESERNAMYDAQYELRQELDAIKFDGYQCDRVISSMIFAAAEIA